MAKAKNKIRQNKRKAETKVQKRANDVLRRSEANLVEGELTRTGNWVLLIPSRRIFWSMGLFQIFDVDPLSKKPSFSALLERVHPEDKPDFEKQTDRGVREGRGFEHDYRLMLSDGSIKHIHAVLQPVADRSGKVREIVGTATDITERILADTELRRSEAYLV